MTNNAFQCQFSCPTIRVHYCLYLSVFMSYNKSNCYRIFVNNYNVYIDCLIFQLRNIYLGNLVQLDTILQMFSELLQALNIWFNILKMLKKHEWLSGLVIGYLQFQVICGIVQCTANIFEAIGMKCLLGILSS